MPAANSNSYLSLSRPWVGFEFLLKICWACPQFGIGLLAFRVDTPIVTQILLKNSVAALDQAWYGPETLTSCGDLEGTGERLESQR